ncbi:MAG TPA: hypothetical protein VMF61_02960 [Candidatus Acidoferrales bacterium]|nr:hypothetical protein [Candidatus Acidoferrales bacterium]
MSRCESCRGAALAETVVVLSFTLILMYGILELAAIGFLQVSGDATTFFAAHEYALGVAQSAITSEQATMAPPFIANAVQFTPAPPPTVDPTLFANIYGTMNNNNRHGGYTLVRPQNFQVYLNDTPANGATAIFNGVFGFSHFTAPITSGAVEAYYLMTQNEMDNYGVGPNTDDTGNIVSSRYASPFLPQSDNIVANMNTPPYYVPNSVIKVCTTPWAGASQAFGEQCGGGADQPYYLGLAEYLSNYNYAPTSLAMGVNAGQVFQAMAAHERVYANLVAAFPDLSGLSNAAEDTTLAQIQYQFQNHAGTSLTNSSCTPWTGSSALTTNVDGSANGYCGAFYENANFKNGGTCGASTGYVPLAWYDPFLWWEHQSGRSSPSWSPRAMWSSSPVPPADPGGFSDGPEGPNCGSNSGNAGGWNGASFGLVYAWDQPNFPSSPIGPGYYPTYPLQGALISGDPAY